MLLYFLKIFLQYSLRSLDLRGYNQRSIKEGKNVCQSLHLDLEGYLNFNIGILTPEHQKRYFQWAIDLNQ